MEPITLCGAVIVVFGLWVEFESIIMKVVRALSRSALMTALLSSAKERGSAASVSSGGYRSYRVGSDLSCRVARS